MGGMDIGWAGVTVMRRLVRVSWLEWIWLAWPKLAGVGTASIGMVGFGTAGLGLAGVDKVVGRRNS
jgi:hypothetical protein